MEEQQNQSIPSQPSPTDQSSWLDRLRAFMKDVKKYSLIRLAVVLFLVLFLYGGYYLNSKLQPPHSPSPAPSQPTPTKANDTTADWKTYTNEELGITIKYPLTYTFEQFSDRPSVILREKSQSRDDFAIYYVDNPNNMSLSDLDEALTEPNEVVGIYSPNFAAAEKNPVTLPDGTKGFLQEGFFCHPHSCNRYVIPYNNRVYEVLILTDISENQSKIMEEVFSTFQFLKPASSSPTITQDPVFCTMEAKLCPDGSSVGRQGPNCEFAPCPN